jgi:hypothetical protein
MKSKNRYIDNLKDLIAEYLKEETISQKLHRTKGGVLNFIGDISKTVFGTLTQSEARNYNKHISELEREQKEYLHISEEQMIIKSTIITVNLTLQKVNQNEKAIKGHEKLVNYSAHRFSKIEETENLNLLSE